jgi:hypothetical protein
MTETAGNLLYDRILTDETFQPGRPEIYELYLYIDDEEFSFAAAEKQSKKFVALETWKAKPGASPEETLTAAYSGSLILSAGKYRKVVCCSGFRNSTLIPNPLYDPYSAEEQLRFTCSIPQGYEILTDELRQLEARNVFSISSEIHHTIASWFQNCEFHHISTALIEYLLSVNRNTSEEIVSVNVHLTFFEIIVTSGKKLIFYNSFSFSTEEEFIYYILFVLEQLHLNPATADLRFTGFITENDKTWSLTKKYIKQVTFGIRPDNYHYSYILDEVPPHFHFNLFSQLVCAS